MRFQKICVVAHARVVEFGTPLQLLALNGHFAQMARNLSGITVLPSGRPW
jgi:ABC-type multidrug transport system fused ATPase/permease subunit